VHEDSRILPDCNDCCASLTVRYWKLLQPAAVFLLRAPLVRHDLGEIGPAQPIPDFSDALPQELKQAEVLVPGMPLYNFGRPQSQAQDKIDQLAQAARCPPHR